MKTIISRAVSPLVAVIALFGLVAFSPLAVNDAVAFSGTAQGGANAARGNDQPADIFGSTGVFRTITNVLLFVLGAISVIMIIIGGLRYVVSGGNATSVTAAKNTILYAIVGVVVALLAYAVINFVLQSFTGGGSSGTNV